jgi:hypothetical protein
MKKVIYVIWGTQANDDFAMGKVVKTDYSCDGHAVKYEFDTDAEVEAFSKGISEAQGWQEATMVKATEVVITETGIQK